MYETRQNKEKVLRTISQSERKNVLKPLQRYVIIKTSENEKNINPPMEQLMNWLAMAKYKIEDMFRPLINLLYNDRKNYEFVWNGGQKEFIEIFECLKTMMKKIESVKSADDRKEVHMPFNNLNDISIQNAKNAIRLMLTLFECDSEELLEKLNKIGVLLWNKREFAYRTFLITCDKYDEGMDSNFNAVILAANNLIDNEYILRNYGGSIAQKINEQYIAINMGQQNDNTFLGGLHTVIHEFLHVLANAKAVNKLQTGNKESSELNMGDESMNEFFARIASSILPKNLASWNSQEHNGTFYNEHIMKSNNLKDSNVDSYENVKILAQAYFLGKNLDVLVKDVND